MYCNEKRKAYIGTFPSYALYCSDSNTAFIQVSVWLKHDMFIVRLQEVILDLADLKYVSVFAYERCPLTGG